MEELLLDGLARLVGLARLSSSREEFLLGGLTEGLGSSLIQGIPLSFLDDLLGGLARLGIISEVLGGMLIGSAVQ